MNKLTKLTSLLLVFSLFGVFLTINTPSVDAATSYYNSISDSATGTTLKSSLRTLISKQTYTSTYDDCKDPSLIKKTDGNASSSKIVLFWSELEVSTTWDGGTTWNREHVWCQSLSGELYGTSYAGSDIHHIRPSITSI